MGVKFDLSSKGKTADWESFRTDAGENILTCEMGCERSLEKVA
jgi:hypothetical protein